MNYRTICKAVLLLLIMKCLGCYSEKALEIDSSSKASAAYIAIDIKDTHPSVEFSLDTFSVMKSSAREGFVLISDIIDSKEHSYMVYGFTENDDSKVYLIVTPTGYIGKALSIDELSGGFLNSGDIFNMLAEKGSFDFWIYPLPLISIMNRTNSFSALHDDESPVSVRVICKLVD